MCLPAARARAARGAPRGRARSRPLERPPARYTVWRGEKRTGFSPFYTNTSRTSTENNTRSNTSSSAPFCGHLRCVFSVVDPGLCGSTNTERAASRATAQNMEKQAGSRNRARGRVGLAPSLFQSGMTMFRGPRIARISSSVRQGREESSRGGTQKREASRIASRSACAFHSAKRGAKFGASCARTHPS